MARVLNPAQVAQIFKLREVLDDWGEPKWSGAYIAEQIGVSESTVWRVLTKRAAYTVKKGGRQAAEDARWEALNAGAFAGAEAVGLEPSAAEIAASLAKVQGMLGQSTGRLEVPDAIKAKADALLGRGPAGDLGNFSAQDGSN